MTCRAYNTDGKNKKSPQNLSRITIRENTYWKKIRCNKILLLLLLQWILKKVIGSSELPTCYPGEGLVVSCCENGVKTLGSIKCKEFVD